MKITLAVAFALTILLSFMATGAENEKPQKVTNWQPIIGMAYPGGHAYIDVNSLGSEATGDEIYQFGMLMISLDNDTEVLVNQKTFTARSLIKNVVIDCKSGLVGPVSDMYFSTAMPTRKDKPVKSFGYEPGKSMVNFAPKNPMRLALCPRPMD